MNLRVAVTGEVKGFSPGAAVKASLKRAYFFFNDTATTEIYTCPG